MAIPFPSNVTSSPHHETSRKGPGHEQQEIQPQETKEAEDTLPGGHITDQPRQTPPLVVNLDTETKSSIFPTYFQSSTGA